MPSQFFYIMLSTNVSCHHKIFKKFRPAIREKFHFEIWTNFDQIFNSVEFQIFNSAGWTLMSLPLKQAIIRKNRLRSPKVMNNLVRACIAGNAKNKQNRSTLPRDSSATAGDKNSRVVPKLVLRHALSGNIYLVQFGSGRENFVLDFFGISPMRISTYSVISLNQSIL